MTVIAARVMRDGIHFAADKQTTCGHYRRTKNEMNLGKLHQVNGMTIGGAGVRAQSQWLAHFAKNHKPIDATESAVSEFIMEFHGWMKSKDASFTFANHYLIAFKRQLFYIESSLGVFSAPSYAAIGSGKDFALAAMHLGNIPSAAVKVASDLDVFCGRGVDHAVHKF